MTLDDAAPSSHAQTLAERVVALAQRGRDDVTILACWALGEVVFIVFRSQLVGDPNRVHGLAYDLTTHPSEAGPATDTDAAAYHILAFEIEEPHRYPIVLADHADAIHWRVITADDDLAAAGYHLPPTTNSVPGVHRRPAPLDQGGGAGGGGW